MIRLSESISIPTYFFVISLSLCLCLFWLVRRTQKRALDRNTALDIALIIMVNGFVGSRLLHVFYEAPHYYAEAPLRILEIWQGGFVWYGGVLAAGAASVGYLFYRRLPLGRWLDLFAPILALGYTLGRFACLATGCCFGSVCTLANGWRFRHPTQAYAMLWEAGVLGLLLWMEKRRTSQSHLRATDLRPRSWYENDGQIFFVWLSLHAVGRLWMEPLRFDDRGPLFYGLSLGTAISLFLLATGLHFIYHRRNRPL